MVNDWPRGRAIDYFPKDGSLEWAKKFLVKQHPVCDYGNYQYHAEFVLNYEPLCNLPATVKYEGRSEEFSWVGYRCDKHSTQLSDTLKITKI